jgi:hypothetical protein
VSKMDAAVFCQMCHSYKTWKASQFKSYLASELGEFPNP